jgi:DNA replication initiation complex subunit (GINS family)
MRRELLGSVLAVLLASGCSGSSAASKAPTTSVTGSSTLSGSPTSTVSTPASAKPTPKPKPKPAATCDSVVKATVAKLENGTIRESDVVATFTACATMAQFSKATISSPGLVDLSTTDALTFVKTACAANASLRLTKLCAAAGAGVAASPSPS